MMELFIALALSLALAGRAELGLFSFGRKKAEEKAAGEQRQERLRAELESELSSLQVELDALAEKLNIELENDLVDRTTTLSRYPRRIVELKIRIDELERALRKLQSTP